MKYNRCFSTTAYWESFLALPTGETAATIDLPPIAERPGTQIGPYKLLEQIGEGGMGIVYMAAQKEPVRRKVALKIIKPGMDTRKWWRASRPKSRPWP